jgi:hypothetical protein
LLNNFGRMEGIAYQNNPLTIYIFEEEEEEDLEEH